MAKADERFAVIGDNENSIGRNVILFECDVFSLVKGEGPLAAAEAVGGDRVGRH